MTIDEGIRVLKRFGVEGLPRATKRAIYRALDAGRKKSLDALTRSTIGQMTRRRADVQLRLAGKFIGPIRGGRPTEGTHIPLIVQRLPIAETFASGSIGVRVYRSGLRTMGFAALIESGGKTKAHQIKPIRLGGYSRKRGERIRQVLAEQPMRFQIGGRWVSMRIITHPGSRVPRTPFMASGGAAATQALSPEFSRAVGEEIRQAGL